MRILFSFTANQKVSQPRKIIYKDDVSESESAPEEEDDDSDFGAKKTPKKSPKKKATPKKGKKAASKKKTPAKVNKFLIEAIVSVFFNEYTQTKVLAIIKFVIKRWSEAESFSIYENHDYPH